MEISVYVLTQFVIVLTISIGVHAYFAYKYMNRNRETGAKENFNYQTSLSY